VLHRREGDVTVSDWHPQSEPFLKENLRLNGLGPLKYENGNWETANPGLGLFELIIGSDVLYERQQPAQLAAFIHAHAAPAVEIIIVDADRGNRPAFCREMATLGYQATMQRAARVLENGDAYKGCVLTLSRTAPSLAA
jgi:predicted nicotinamide N-methyase